MESTFVIAEAGVNHNGSIEMAKEMIDVAVECGADAVKFQTFKSDNIVSKKTTKAPYQKETTDPNETQLEMLKKLELDLEAHEILIEYCKKKEITFLSTPFDIESVDLLSSNFDIPVLKVPSGEITNGPLLLKIAQTKKPIIMSTGMSTISEIETALAVLAFGYIDNGEKPSLKAFIHAYSSDEGMNYLKDRVTLLHCTTEYPTLFKEVNLSAMDTLRQTFGLNVGYSDHTLGISVAIAAVARGAKVIEKHFTLDKDLPGPDHKASLEPAELMQMIKSIREVEMSIGHSRKVPSTSELVNRDLIRKSIVAAKPIKSGDFFTEENLTTKRSTQGLSPMYYWDILNKVATKNYEEDENIHME